MSSSDEIWEMLDLSMMTYDPSESKSTCFEDSTFEESMCHILSFEILQKTKGMFLVRPLGGLFIAFQLG